MKIFHCHSTVLGCTRMLQHFGFDDFKNQPVWLLDTYHWTIGIVYTDAAFYDRHYDSFVNIADAIAIHSSTIPASAPVQVLGSRNLKINNVLADALLLEQS